MTSRTCRPLIPCRRAVAALVCTAALSGCGGGDDSAGSRPASGPLARSAPEVASAAPTYDPTLLLDWAERRYPAWFPGPQANLQSPPYVYRYYPSTLNHLGVDGNRVAVLGPISSNQVQTVGTLADYECQVLPGRCPAGGPSLAQRRAAAEAMAATHADCVAVQPFHWSVGDAGGRLAEGSLGSGAPDADTVMPIASASKWLYAAYVAEKRNGQPTAEDVALMNFTSGWTGFDGCLRGQTVAQCQTYQSLLVRNGGFEPGHVGRFFYSGGHMQKHAVLMGLGSDDTQALAQHVGQPIGASLVYTQPQLAGGVATSAAEYGRFLQRVAAGRLQIASLLGRHAVCANPDTCSTALSSPVAGSTSWNYAFGHWVENDPVSGDGSFSSAGVFGFYPWLDASRTWWGVVARFQNSDTGNPEADQRPARESAVCGLRIRRAWLSGSAG